MVKDSNKEKKRGHKMSQKKLACIWETNSIKTKIPKNLDERFFMEEDNDPRGEGVQVSLIIKKEMNTSL